MSKWLQLIQAGVQVDERAVHSMIKKKNQLKELLKTREGKPATDGARDLTPDTDSHAFIFNRNSLLAGWQTGSLAFSPIMSFAFYFKREKSTNQTEQTHTVQFR